MTVHQRDKVLIKPPELQEGIVIPGLPEKLDLATQILGEYSLGPPDLRTITNFGAVVICKMKPLQGRLTRKSDHRPRPDCRRS